LVSNAFIIAEIPLCRKVTANRNRPQRSWKAFPSEAGEGDFTGQIADAKYFPPFLKNRWKKNRPPMAGGEADVRIYSRFSFAKVSNAETKATKKIVPMTQTKRWSALMGKRRLQKRCNHSRIIRMSQETGQDSTHSQILTRYCFRVSFNALKADTSARFRSNFFPKHTLRNRKCQIFRKASAVLFVFHFFTRDC
jgi:hypothetical protein